MLYFLNLRWNINLVVVMVLLKEAKETDLGCITYNENHDSAFIMLEGGNEISVKGKGEMSKLRI